MRLVSFPILRSVLPLLAGCLVACQRAPEADVAAFGRVWTGNPARPWAEAVATRGDTIVAVGDSGEVARSVGKATEVLSVPAGGMVVPGFMDAHTHFLDGGIQLVSVDLRTADTPEEFVGRIKAFAAERKPGEWIIGGDWDHERWPGAPLPTRAWLDSVTPDNPVFVNRLDGHMAVANSAALRAAGITRATKDVYGGEIVRDRRTGEPTGILKDNAEALVSHVIPPPSEAQLDAALARALSFAASKGVSATNYMSAPTTWLGAFQRARAAGTLTVRVKMFFPIKQWRWVADTVAAAGPGDDWLRIDGVKGYMDGSLGSTTALLFHPYLDAPNTRGLETTPLDSMRGWVQSADSAGLQVAVHAIGDRANALLLDIFDSVAAVNGPRDRRFRVEHAQHLRPEDITRIARTNVIPSMQPAHIIDDGRWAAKRIDSTLLRTTYAFRDLLDQGAHLGFGSDWTVAPLDPLIGIYAAVTRRTNDDKNPGGWFPGQKVTVDEALRAYTVANAYGVFAEGRRGVLAPGARADLVVLDRDLTRIPPVSIANARVLVTVAGGRVVYRAP